MSSKLEGEKPEKEGRASADGRAGGAFSDQPGVVCKRRLCRFHLAFAPTTAPACFSHKSTALRTRARLVRDSLRVTFLFALAARAPVC